jgi:hypothetical protein
MASVDVDVMTGTSTKLCYNEEPFRLYFGVQHLNGKEPDRMDGERGVVREFTSSRETQEILGKQQMYKIPLSNALDHGITHSELVDTSDFLATCREPVGSARVIDKERVTKHVESHKQSVLQKHVAG